MDGAVMVLANGSLAVEQLFLRFFTVAPPLTVVPPPTHQPEILDRLELIIAAVVAFDVTSISQLGALSVTPPLTSRDCELDGSSTRMQTARSGVAQHKVVNVPVLGLAARRHSVGFLDVVHLDIEPGQQRCDRRIVVNHDARPRRPRIALAQQLTGEAPARFQRSDELPPQRRERAGRAEE